MSGVEVAEGDGVVTAVATAADGDWLAGADEALGLDPEHAATRTSAAKDGTGFMGITRTSRSASSGQLDRVEHRSEDCAIVGI